MPERDSTFYLEAIFAVHPHADEHVRSEQAIRAEVRSWLESLGATVRSVTVREAPAIEGTEQ